MKRTGYDANTRQYTFHDSTTGVQYISAPGERYGTLLPAATANYVNPKLGPGRKQTCNYFLLLCSASLFLTHDQCKRTTVRCSSPTTTPRRHDLHPVLHHAATRVPQTHPAAVHRHTPVPLIAGMDTDILAVPPLPISCLPISSIARRPRSRNKHRRGPRQSRRRRTRRVTSACLILQMRKGLSLSSATIPGIRKGLAMRYARPCACWVARSRRSGATAHTDSGVITTVTFSSEQHRHSLSHEL
jgi:hypothetical protein